ncbi:MAG: hypothetical protein KAS05_03515 [Candidatus Omnitrophica bacterium]|nr:hypothetical protein [Candidatus Omnitrophota bacterium]
MKKYQKAYEKILGLIQKIGKVTKENSAKYIIRAQVYGSDVVIRIVERKEKMTRVKIKARKHMISKFCNCNWYYLSDFKNIGIRKKKICL